MIKQVYFEVAPSILKLCHTDAEKAVVGALYIEYLQKNYEEELIELNEVRTESSDIKRILNSIKQSEQLTWTGHDITEVIQALLKDRLTGHIVTLVQELNTISRDVAESGECYQVDSSYYRMYENIEKVALESEINGSLYATAPVRNCFDTLSFVYGKSSVPSDMTLKNMALSGVEAKNPEVKRAIRKMLTSEFGVDASDGVPSKDFLEDIQDEPFGV